VGGGDKVGPDLRGVLERHDEAWLKAFISNPAKVRASGDEYLKALMARFPGVRMPYLGLGEVDAGDVIEYLRARNAKLAASEPAAVGHEPQHD
jgi:protein SCO1/2